MLRWTLNTLHVVHGVVLVVDLIYRLDTTLDREHNSCSPAGDSLLAGAGVNTMQNKTLNISQ